MKMPIPGFPGYFVDPVGNVYNRFHRMKTRINRGGYACIGLVKDGKCRYPLVHRMVLSAFVGPANGLHCNHKNGNRSDNRVENLEWVTRGENERHARKVLGKKLHGTHHPSAKLTDEQVRQVRELRQAGMTYAVLSAKFGLGMSQLHRIANGRVWRHVE